MRAEVNNYLMAELEKIFAIIRNTNDLLNPNESEVAKRKDACREMITNEKEILKDYKKSIEELSGLDEYVDKNIDLFIKKFNTVKNGRTRDDKFKSILEMTDVVKLILPDLEKMSDLINKILEAESKYSVQNTEEQLVEITKLLEKINDYKPANISSAKKAPEVLPFISSYDNNKNKPADANNSNNNDESDFITNFVPTDENEDEFLKYINGRVAGENQGYENPVADDQNDKTVRGKIAKYLNKG